MSDARRFDEELPRGAKATSRRSLRLAGVVVALLAVGVALYFALRNSPPTISDLPDVVLGEGGKPVTFTVAADSTPPGKLKVSAATDNPALIPDGGLDLSREGGVWTLRISPTPGAVGTAVITITVVDGWDKWATRSFKATVPEAPNLPPTVRSIPEQFVLTRGGGPLTFEVGDDKTPPGELRVAATSSLQTVVPDAGLTVRGEGSTRSLEILPGRGASGTVVVTVAVTDHHGATTRQSFKAIVPEQPVSVTDSRPVAERVVSAAAPGVDARPGDRTQFDRVQAEVEGVRRDFEPPGLRPAAERFLRDVHPDGNAPLTWPRVRTLRGVTGATAVARMDGWRRSVERAEAELARLEAEQAEVSDAGLAAKLAAVESPPLSKDVATALAADPATDDLDLILGTLAVSQFENPNILNHVLANRVIELYKSKTLGWGRDAFLAKIREDDADHRETVLKFQLRAVKDEAAKETVRRAVMQSRQPFTLGNFCAEVGKAAAQPGARHRHAVFARLGRAAWAKLKDLPIIDLFDSPNQYCTLFDRNDHVLMAPLASEAMHARFASVRADIEKRSDQAKAPSPDGSPLEYWWQEFRRSAPAEQPDIASFRAFIQGLKGWYRTDAQAAGGDSPATNPFNVAANYPPLLDAVASAVAAAEADPIAAGVKPELVAIRRRAESSPTPTTDVPPELAVPADPLDARRLDVFWDELAWRLAKQSAAWTEANPTAASGKGYLGALRKKYADLGQVAPALVEMFPDQLRPDGWADEGGATVGSLDSLRHLVNDYGNLLAVAGAIGTEPFYLGTDALLPIPATIKLASAKPGDVVPGGAGVSGRALVVQAEIAAVVRVTDGGRVREEVVGTGVVVDTYVALYQTPTPSSVADSGRLFLWAVRFPADQKATRDQLVALATGAASRKSAGGGREPVPAPTSARFHTAQWPAGAPAGEAGNESGLSVRWEFLKEVSAPPVLFDAKARLAEGRWALGGTVNGKDWVVSERWLAEVDAAIAVRTAVADVRSRIEELARGSLKAAGLPDGGDITWESDRVLTVAVGTAPRRAALRLRVGSDGVPGFLPVTLTGADADPVVRSLLPTLPTAVHARLSSAARWADGRWEVQLNFSAPVRPARAGPAEVTLGTGWFNPRDIATAQPGPTALLPGDVPTALTPVGFGPDGAVFTAAGEIEGKRFTLGSFTLAESGVSFAPAPEFEAVGKHLLASTKAALPALLRTAVGGALELPAGLKLVPDGLDAGWKVSYAIDSGFALPEVPLPPSGGTIKLRLIEGRLALSGPLDGLNAETFTALRDRAAQHKKQIDDLLSGPVVTEVAGLKLTWRPQQGHRPIDWERGLDRVELKGTAELAPVNGTGSKVAVDVLRWVVRVADLPDRLPTAELAFRLPKPEQVLDLVGVNAESVRAALGLRMIRAGWDSGRWGIEGTLQPPGFPAPIAFQVGPTASVDATALLNTVLTAAMNAIVDCGTVEGDVLRLRLVPAKNPPDGRSFIAELEVRQPVPFVAEVTGLELGVRDGNLGWGSPAVRLHPSAHKQLSDEVLARLRAAGLDALVPADHPLGVRVTVESWTVDPKAASWGVSLAGKLYLTGQNKSRLADAVLSHLEKRLPKDFPERDEAIRGVADRVEKAVGAGLPYRLSPSGLELSTEWLTGLAKDATGFLLVTAAGVAEAQAGEAVRAWLGDALRGLKMAELADMSSGGTTSGLVYDLSAVQAHLAGKPMFWGDASVARVVVHRVTSFRFYHFKSVASGSTEVNFAPRPPVREEIDKQRQLEGRPKLDDVAFGKLVDDHKRLTAVLKPRLDAGEYGFEFDVTVDFAGGLRVLLTGEAVATPSEIAEAERKGTPLPPPARGAFRLDHNGLRVRKPFVTPLVVAPGGDSSLAFLSAAGDEFLRAVGTVLPVEVRRAGGSQGRATGLPAPDGDNWVSVADLKRLDVGVELELILDKAKLAKRLGVQPGGDSGEVVLGTLAVTPAKVELKAGKLDPAAVLKQVLSAVCPNGAAVQVGGLKLTLERPEWKGGEVVLAGSITGLFASADAPLATGLVAVKFSNLRLTARGPDFSRVTLDNPDELKKILETAVREKVLREIGLPGVGLTIVEPIRLSPAELAFGFEVTVSLFGEQVSVRVAEVRLTHEGGKVVVRLNGVSTDVAKVLGDTVKEALASELTKRVAKLPPFEAGPLVASIGGARWADGKLVLSGTAEVKGWLPPGPWAVTVGADGRVELDVKQLLGDQALGALADRVGARLLAESDPFWVKLSAGGVPVRPTMPVVQGLTVALQLVINNPDYGKDPKSPTSPQLSLMRKIPLPSAHGTPVAEASLDLRSGALKVTPAKPFVDALKNAGLEELRKFAETEFGTAEIELKDIDLLGDKITVKVKPYPDGTKGETYADLTLVVGGNKLSGATAGAAQDQSCVLRRVQLTGTKLKPELRLDQCRLERGHVLARWLAAKSGVDSFLTISRLDIADNRMTLSAALDIPGAFRAAVEGVSVPLNKGADAALVVLANALLSQIDKQEVKFGDGQSLTVNGYAVNFVNGRLGVDATVTVKLLESPIAVAVPGKIGLKDGNPYVDFAGAKEVVRQVVSGLLGEAAKELSKAVGGLSIDQTDLMFRGDIPVGFKAGGRFKLDVLGADFADLEVGFADLEVSANKLKAPTKWTLTIPATITVPPAIDIFEPGGSFDTRSKDLQMKAKVGITASSATKNLIYMDNSLTIPLAKPTRIRTAGSLIVFHMLPLGTITGEVNFEQGSVVVDLQTLPAIKRIIEIKGHVGLYCATRRFEGDLMVRVIGCEIGRAVILLDFREGKVRIAGHVNLIFMKVEAAFTIDSGWSNPHLFAKSSICIGSLEIVWIEADVTARRVKVHAGVAIVSVKIMFPTPWAVDTRMIEEQLLNLLNPVRWAEALAYLLSGNTNISFGSPPGPGGGGSGGGNGGEEGGDGTDGGDGGNGQQQGGDKPKDPDGGQPGPPPTAPLPPPNQPNTTKEPDKTKDNPNPPGDDWGSGTGGTTGSYRWVMETVADNQAFLMRYHWRQNHQYQGIRDDYAMFPFIRERARWDALAKKVNPGGADPPGVTLLPWGQLIVRTDELSGSGFRRGVYHTAPNYQFEMKDNKPRWVTKGTDYTFIAFPKNFPTYIADELGKGNQWLPGEASNVCWVQHWLVTQVLPPDSGWLGRYRVTGDNGSHPTGVEKVIDARMIDAGTPLLTMLPGEGDRRPVVVTIDRNLTDTAGRNVLRTYLDSPRTRDYPFWVFHPKGYLVSIFSKDLEKLDKDTRERLLNPEAAANHPLYYYELANLASEHRLSVGGGGRADGREQGSYTPQLQPLSRTPDIGQAWKGMFANHNYTEIQVLVEPEIGKKPMHTRYTLPGDLAGFLRGNVEKITNGLDFDPVPRPGGQEVDLIITVNKDDVPKVFAPAAAAIDYPLWLAPAGTPPGDARPSLLFRLSKAGWEKFKDTTDKKGLLNIDQLKARPEFLRRLLELVREVKAPLQPLQLHEDGKLWTAYFLQSDGTTHRLVAAREVAAAAGTTVQAVGFRISKGFADELDQRAATVVCQPVDDLKAADALTRLVVGLDEPTALERIKAGEAESPLPLWVLTSAAGLEVAPLGQPWLPAEAVAADELLRPVNWAKRPHVLDQLAAVGPPDRGLLVPLPYREGKAAEPAWCRYFARLATKDHPAAVVRVAEGKSPKVTTDVVGLPETLLTALKQFPTKTQFRRVEQAGGAVAIVAKCDDDATDKLTASAGPTDTYPLWVLAKDGGTAPFLALRPAKLAAGQGRLAPGHLAKSAFDFDALAARPDRVALLRAMSARGPVRPLAIGPVHDTAKAGNTDWRDAKVDWRWVCLSGDHQALLSVEEGLEKPGAVPAEPLSVPCPQPLRTFLESQRTPPEAIDIRTRVSGGRRRGVVWVVPDAKTLEEKPADLRTAYPEIAGREEEYPLWALSGPADRGTPAPLAIYSALRAGSVPAFEPGAPAPTPLSPSLLDRPDLIDELIGGAAATGRVFHLARHDDGPDGRDWFTVLYTRPSGPDHGQLLVVEGGTHPATGKSCRTVPVAGRVSLEAFMLKVADRDPRAGSLAAAFWADLKGLPPGHSVLWAGPKPDAAGPPTGLDAEKAAALPTAGGYVVGPVAPAAAPSGEAAEKAWWAAAGAFKVRYSNRGPRPAKDIDLKWEATGDQAIKRITNQNQREQAPTSLRVRDRQDMNLLEEYDLVLVLARAVLDLGGRDSPEWKTHPRELFQP
ncbi:hypothetical protein [Paludisphaera sp.]|uniref:hypothetical protein n=1 Tax=Paludisphaera sp. TaxID=2017432 RepID=UPI00301E2FE8